MCALFCFVCLFGLNCRVAVCVVVWCVFCSCSFDCLCVVCFVVLDVVGVVCFALS